MDAVMLLADIAVRVILYGSGALAAFVLIVVACAPRAAEQHDDDLHGLDLLDRPSFDGLTEWDLDTGEDDPANLCDAYPYECEWDDVPCCNGCATGMGPCHGPGYQLTCLTHHHVRKAHR